MNYRELDFKKRMERQGLVIIFEPRKFKMEGRTYFVPDFYCSFNDTYYEVIGSRQRYYQNKGKLKLFQKMYPSITLKIVKPNGEPYVEGIPHPRKFKMQDTKLITVTYADGERGEIEIRLGKFMNNLHMSIYKFAKLTGREPQTVKNWLSGKNLPNAKDFPRIMKVLKVGSINHLFTFKTN